MASTQDIRDILEADFDVIAQRKGAGNQMFDYIPGSDVLRRVMDASDEWSWEITGYREINTYRKEWTDRDTGEVRGGYADPVPTLMVFGRLTIPPLGTRDGMGVATIEPGKGEDNLKGAETDAFKRAAAKFGVGFRQLYESSGAPSGGYAHRSVPAQNDGGGNANSGGGGSSEPGPGGVRGYPASEGQAKFVRDLMQQLDMSADDLFAKFGPGGEYGQDDGKPILPVRVDRATDLKSWQARSIIEYLKAERQSKGTNGQTGTMQ